MIKFLSLNRKEVFQKFSIILMRKSLDKKQVIWNQISDKKIIFANFLDSLFILYFFLMKNLIQEKTWLIIIIF